MAETRLPVGRCVLYYCTVSESARAQGKSPGVDLLFFPPPPVTQPAVQVVSANRSPAPTRSGLSAGRPPRTRRSPWRAQPHFAPELVPTAAAEFRPHQGHSYLQGLSPSLSFCLIVPSHTIMPPSSLTWPRCSCEQGLASSLRLKM